MKYLSLTVFLIMSMFSCFLDAEGDGPESVNFDELIQNPTRFDGKFIRLEGIYSGHDEPLVFRNEEEFRTFQNRHAVLIVSKKENIPEERCLRPKHGAPLIVSGVFHVIPDDFVQVYLGELTSLKEFRRKGDND